MAEHKSPILGYWADDGNQEVHYPYANTGFDAAEEYVYSGWNNPDESSAITVHSWRIDENGNKYGTDAHLIIVHPNEPSCSHGEHNWQSPHRLVGGNKENPGVWGGSGCSVHCTEVCLKCGMARRTGTPTQGYEYEYDHSYVKYEPNFISEEQLAQHIN